VADGVLAVAATREAETVMPIAMLYHDVVEPGRDDASGFRGAGAARYKLTRADFAAHLGALARAVRGGPVAALEALAASGGASSWALTFDDGGASALEPTADLLEAHGWRGFFFVTTARVGTPGFLRAAGVRELRRRGHVVGSHSCSHPERMASCGRKQLLDEWRRSREVLEGILGEPVRTASVPGGYYSRAVAAAAAEAGCTVLFNSEPTTGVTAVGACRVVGRYTVYRGTTARAAARLITSRPARWRQALLWNVKKVAKAVGGRGYLAVRRRLLVRAYPEAADAEPVKVGRE
jgi:peptidoglycan/xylan/chitin deacetylase (PgdA/CDA1 family)